jgi:hypothetical protein
MKKILNDRRIFQPMSSDSVTDKKKENKNMTDRKDRIKREIERTLGCLEEIDTIDPSPFFYSRLAANLESHVSIENTFSARFFRLSALKPALIGGLIIINIATATLISQGTSTETISREESLTTLAEEYQLVQTDNQIKEIFE